MGSHKAGGPLHTDPRTEDRLDQELEQTFPASDALQITRDRRPHPADHRRPKPPTVKHRANETSD